MSVVPSEKKRYYSKSHSASKNGTYPIPNDEDGQLFG